MQFLRTVSLLLVATKAVAADNVSAFCGKETDGINTHVDAGAFCEQKELTLATQQEVCEFAMDASGLAFGSVSTTTGTLDVNKACPALVPKTRTANTCPRFSAKVEDNETLDPDVPKPEKCVLKRKTGILQYAPNFPEDRPDVYIEAEVIETGERFQFFPANFPGFAGQSALPIEDFGQDEGIFQTLFEEQEKLGGLGFKLRYVGKRGPGGWSSCKYSPIAFDLNKDGVVGHITDNTVGFKIDITGDGDEEHLSEWFAPDEGILIDTHNKDGLEDFENGIITGDHLMGDMAGKYTDGFAKLATYDDNCDDKLTGKELDGLYIWVDTNSNLILDEGELHKFSDFGIVALNTIHDDLKSYAELEDGSPMLMQDLWFNAFHERRMARRRLTEENHALRGLGSKSGSKKDKSTSGSKSGSKENKSGSKKDTSKNGSKEDKSGSKEDKSKSGSKSGSKKDKSKSGSKSGSKEDKSGNSSSSSDDGPAIRTFDQAECKAAILCSDPEPGPESPSSGEPPAVKMAPKSAPSKSKDSPSSDESPSEDSSSNGSPSEDSPSSDESPAVKNAPSTSKDSPSSDDSPSDEDPKTKSDPTPSKSKSLEEDEITEEDKQTTRSFTKGDPHFKTHGGELYDFHGGCDLVLMENPRFKNDLGMSIHIRTKIETWWSYVSASAIRVGDETLEVVGGDQDNWLYINGVANKFLEDKKWYSVQFSGLKLRFKQTKLRQGFNREVHLYLGNPNVDGEKLFIKSYHEFVKVELDAHGSNNYEGSLGLLGRFPDGNRVGRDGENFIEDVNAFGQHWMVQPEEPTLFHAYKGGGIVLAGETCAMPEVDTALKKMLRQRRLANGIPMEAAEKACAHLDAADERKACVDDVVTTQDVDMASVW